MSSFTSDPATLTIEQLKRELVQHSIKLPGGSQRKDVYVRLYRDNLLDKAQKLDFSSDDEDLSITKQRKKKPGTPQKRVVKGSPKKMATGKIDVMQLSDQELVNKLRELGAEVGPILEMAKATRMSLNTTRRVYQRKLEKLLTEAVKAEPVVITRTQPDDYSDKDEEETIPMQVVETQTTPGLSGSVRQRRTRQEVKPAEVVPAVEEPVRGPGSLRKVTTIRQSKQDTVDGVVPPRKEEPIIKATYENNSTVESTITSSSNTFVSQVTKNSTESYTAATDYSASASVLTTKAATDQKQPKKKGLSIWAQVGILLIVAVVIFLIIHNMEPGYRNLISLPK